MPWRQDVDLVFVKTTPDRILGQRLAHGHLCQDARLLAFLERVAQMSHCEVVLASCYHDIRRIAVGGRIRQDGQDAGEALLNESESGA